MTMRLSMSSLAGTARTLVAVGTARLAAMFCAVRAAAPRSLVSSASCGSGAAGACGFGAAGAWGGGAAGGCGGACGWLAAWGCGCAWGWLAGWGWLTGWLTVGALGAAPGPLGRGVGGGSTSVSAEPLSGIAGFDPAPFPRVGR